MQLIKDTCNLSVIRCRVVARGGCQVISGLTFQGFGAHHDCYPSNYLTAAAAVGMTRSDVDSFIKRLDKVLTKVLCNTRSEPSQVDGCPQSDLVEVIGNVELGNSCKGVTSIHDGSASDS